MQSPVMNHAFEDLMRRRVLAVCGGGLVLLATLTVPLYGQYGLHVAWVTAAGPVAGLLVLLGLALYFVRYPGRPEERALGDMVLVLSSVVALVILLTPAQYLAIALKRPLVDSWLADADARLGVNVSALAAWTRNHPRVDAILKAGYFTLLPQFIATPLLLGIVFRSRERLWEYTFHFYTCALVTLAALTVLPAACPPQYLHFTSTISQTQVYAHINALRAGTFGPLRFGEFEGLVSIPSFHAAGGLFVTWAFRDRRILCALFGLVNAILILATVLSGVHYLVDVIASFGLFAMSVLAYNRLCRAPSISEVSERETPAAA